MAEVVAAVRAQLEGEARAAEMLLELRVARERAVRRFVVEQGLAPLQAAPLIRAGLLEAGFTEAELRGVGVSDGAIRLAVERPR